MKAQPNALFVEQEWRENVRLGILNARVGQAKAKPEDVSPEARDASEQPSGAVAGVVFLLLCLAGVAVIGGAIFVSLRPDLAHDVLAAVWPL